MKNVKRFATILTMTALFAACGNGKNKQALIEAQRQKTLDSMNLVMQKQKAIDSMKLVEAKKVPVHNTHTVEYVNSSSNAAYAPAAKKKGMSTPVKGALIGAGVGAVSGAVIDKKHGRGAVLGGLIGAGAGAGTGVIIDNKKKKSGQ
jgi:YMGG-like Gly-zipper